MDTTELQLTGVVRRLLSAAWLGMALVVQSCQSAKEEPGSGGETHFLTRCDESSEACGQDLSCLNQVCTLPCESDASCRAYPGAECVAAEASGQCEVSCAEDSDCDVLSVGHRCDRGTCRARDAACADDGVEANQVVLIGDSFFAQSHQITAFVEDLGRKAGALATGERYRDNSSLLANQLAEQGLASLYAAATGEGEIRIVIMTGGGADVLAGSCDTVDASCPAIADAAQGAAELFQRMADDGVLHVVYAFYPDPLEAALREKVDALRPLVESACAASPAPCHFVDLRPTFAGHYDEYILSDGMNPTAAGSEATASAIWATMERECIAQ